MKRISIKTITTFVLALALLASFTACSTKENERETEDTVEETEAAKTPETSAVETAAVPAEETAAEAVAEVLFADDDARYAAFFQDQYPNLASSMMLDVNNIAVLIAYADLDADGANELMIGDVEGVYAVVSEAGGQYQVTEFNGWRTQYGAVPCEYVGNGCFLTSIYNGNNYGGEFCVDVLWRYDSSTVVGRVVLARLSGSWDPSNLSENLSKWELYVAADENGSLAENSDGFIPDYPNYNYSMIDFGDNYQFVDGERVYNEIETEFYAYVDAHREADPLGSFTWRSIDEVL